MPLYEYQCRGCGQTSEVMQRVSEPPLTTCDDCGGELKKLISAPAFQFKGSGWYVTDYARGGKAAGKEGEAKPDGAKTDKPDGSKPDSGDGAAAKAPDPAGKTKSERIASSS